MVKSVKEKELEKQIAEATAKQAGEIAQAQIEVYEGQNFEAKQKWEEAKQKRAQARSKLPEKIPDDSEYKERLLEAQYIEARVVSPKQVQQVREYREEIKKRQQAKETVQVLDKEIPQLYTKAVEESKEVEKKVEQAKQAEIKKQEALITSYQKQITEEKQRVQREAQAREDAYKAYLKSNSGDKSISKKIHYGQVGGVELMKGDIILSAGRGYTNVSFHKSYYERAVESYKARGYNVTVADLQKVSATGRRTQSGKIRDSAMRAVLDPSGKSEEAYQQSRAQAKRNVASAYASMSAKEKVHSSAMASTYATDPSLKFDAQMNLVSEMTHGLISPKKKGESQDDYYERMRVYESNELYKKTGGLIDIRKDVTSEAMKIIQKQREIELANRRQQEYVKELRAGNIGIATALTTPQTTQSYTGKSTVNLNTFLKERGLVAKTAPDSMFKPDYSEKLTEARQRASMSGTEMGDLRTQSPMFVGKTDQPYQMRKAGTTELRQRELAQERIDVFKPKVMQQQPVKDSIAFKFTNLKDPQVGTLDSGKPLEQKGVSGFGVTPSQSYLDKMYDYTVPSNQKSVFPLMSGQTFQATTPVTFGTQKEAEEYVKSKPKEKVFSGTNNEAWNRLMYAPAVYTGEVPDPRETGDSLGTARLVGSTILSPLVNVASSVVNLTQPEDKQIPIYRTGSDVLIGDTIKDFEEGQPLRGSGVTGLGKYIEQDPLRATLELPAEAVMWVGGGKAISLGVQGAGAGVKIAGQLGTKIIQSNAPTIVKVPTMAVMGAGQAVKRTGAKVSAIPSRIGSSIYDYGNIPRGYGQGGYKAFRSEIGDKKFTPTQQMVRQGIVRPYDKFTMFQGSRVGFGTKMNFIMTPSGRMFVRQATDIGSDIGARPQFLNRQVAMFETDSVTGFATRGKMKTVEATLPKAKAFESEVFAPTKKTELVLKNPPKEPYKFPELVKKESFPELVKVEDIPTRVPTITKPDIDLDRVRLTRIGQRGKDVEVKKVKTAVDEITFYSDTTGDLIKGVKRPSKAEIQGELDNYKAFENPTITGTREEIQTFKTSTSRTSVKGELKYSELAGGKIKLKGSPIREIDTIATGAKVSGERNIEIVEDLVEKGRIKEVGKKTVIQGSDYFAGGKSAGQLKSTLESRNPTQYRNIKGEWKPRDESILYESRDSTRLDTVAFKQTMKESNLLRELERPINQPTKKINIPDGVQTPTSKTKFTGESTKSGQTLASTTVKETSKKFRKQVAKADVKTSPYRSAIIGSATKASAVVGTKSLTSTKVDTGVKIQQNIKTGLIQETALKTQQELKTPQRLKQPVRMKLDTGLKLDTGTKLKTQQKSLSIYASPVRMESKLQRPKPAFIPPIPELAQRDRKGKGKRGKKAGFIGNVRLDNIIGMYKRKEITYGAKKVRKLERLDMRLTTKTPNRLSAPSSSLLKTRKKKKNKTETIFGRTVPKTKDKFSGFKENKEKKKTRRKKSTKISLL